MSNYLIYSPKQESMGLYCNKLLRILLKKKGSEGAIEYDTSNYIKQMSFPWELESWEPVHYQQLIFH